MSTFKTHQALLDYINSATDLAESVTRNIKHRKSGVAVIDDKTVVYLNKFIIAANAIKDLPTQLEHSTIKFN